MVPKFQGKWRLPTCLCCVSLGLALLYVGTHNARGQIPPVTSTVEFSESNYTVSQGQTAEIVVTLNTSSQQDVTVDYVTSDGTAQGGVDYMPTSGTLIIPAGSLSQTFTVTTMIDPSGQSSLTVNLTLSSQSGADMGSPSTATLYLVNGQQACENAPPY